MLKARPILAQLLVHFLPICIDKRCDVVDAQVREHGQYGIDFVGAPHTPTENLEVSWDVFPFDETTQDEGVVLSFDDQHPAMTSGEENFARVKPKNMGIVDVRDKASEALLLVGVQRPTLIVSPST